jgi:energy-converting hydrogenase A subunit M
MEHNRCIDMMEGVMLHQERQKLSQCWLFQQHNDLKCTVKSLQIVSKVKRIHKINWLSQTFDFNSIQNLHKHLNQQVEGGILSNKVEFFVQIEQLCQSSPWVFSSILVTLYRDVNNLFLTSKDTQHNVKDPCCKQKPITVDFNILMT